MNIRAVTFDYVTPAKGKRPEQVTERWRIIDTDTGEILDNKGGYGYPNAEKAYRSWEYNNSITRSDRIRMTVRRVLTTLAVVLVIGGSYAMHVISSPIVSELDWEFDHLPTFRTLTTPGLEGRETYLIEKKIENGRICGIYTDDEGTYYLWDGRLSLVDMTVPYTMPGAFFVEPDAIDDLKWIGEDYMRLAGVELGLCSYAGYTENDDSVVFSYKSPNSDEVLIEFELTREGDMMRWKDLTFLK